MSLALADGISTADTGTGTVLLDERAGRYWQLNPTGALILRTLLAGATPRQAAAQLAARYPALAPGQADADLDALVACLITAGLVTQP